MRIVFAGRRDNPPFKTLLRRLLDLGYLPADSSVLESHRNYLCSAIDVVIWSAEFSPTPDCMPLEHIVIDWGRMDLDQFFGQ